jgi:hypothetical protein
MQSLAFGQLAGQPMNSFITLIFFDGLIGLIGGSVARFVLPLLSFRRVYVQPINSPLGTKFNGLGYRYDEDGRIEIESTLAGFIGLVICLVAFFAFGLLI